MPKSCNHQPGSPTRASKQPILPDRRDADKRSRFTLVVGAGLSFLLILGMTVLDNALKTPEAPAGIISFELAGTLAGAEKIMGSWDGPARIQAGISLGIDFFFLMAYACTLATACRMVAARMRPRRPWMGTLGCLMAGGAWCAACLDTVENMALIQLLVGRGEDWHAVLAAGCAWLKFGLVSVVLAYLFLGVVLVFLRLATVP
ncbi:MAG: hypothetical protein KQI78_19065 [Deltaproteobacteria bacterium]|nr:hypothetical protein [Deltaproteobacteria bacterium]